MTFPFYASSRSQRSLSIVLYSSEVVDPLWTDIPECQRCGELEVAIPAFVDDATWDALSKVDVKMFFGGTEIKVEAVSSVTGEKRETTINFCEQ